MASTFFFVPLNRIKLRENKNLEFKKDNNIEPPKWAKNIISECYYSTLDKNETKKYYYRHTLHNTKKIIERQVTIIPYVIHYKPSKHNNDYYYLMLKVDVDKLFPQLNTYTTINDRFCTIDDLIYLKKLFYEDELYYPQEDPIHSIQEWVNELANKLENRKHNIHREYTSLLNLHAIRINEPLGGFDEHSVTEEFDKAYYGNIDNKNLSVENTLGEKERLYLKQAYGLLLADNNYRRVQDKELNDVLEKNYSNNICEEYYAVKSSMLWVHTHSSFDNNIISHKELKSYENLYEICEVMSTRQKLNRMSKLFTISPAKDIKKQLASLSAYMESNTFNLLEMDRKLEYLFNAMGVNDEFISVKSIGELAADGANIELTQQQNHMITVLTFCSVLIGLITIFPFSTNNNCNMLNIILNNCGCNEITVCYSVVIVFFLILVVGLLSLICVNSFKIKNELKKTLKELEEML